VKGVGVHDHVFHRADQRGTEAGDERRSDAAPPRPRAQTPVPSERGPATGPGIAFPDAGRITAATTGRPTTRRASYAVSTRIRRASPAADAPPGHEKTSWADPAALSAEMAARRRPVPEPEVGRTVRLPDIVVESAGVETDSVNGQLQYQGTTARHGPEPATDFGDTQPGSYVLTGITVTKNEGSYDVSATLQHHVTFQVRDEVGPGTAREKNIESENDPRITARNYEAIAADLTPRMNDLGGRPPRLAYWSRGLTIIHEQFHADDNVGLSRTGVGDAQGWLNQQQTDSAEGVQHLLEQAVVQVKKTRDDGMKMPGREERAYGDGAPLYLALVNRIRSKFSKGEGGARADSVKPDPNKQGTSGSKPKRDLRSSG
jgi:hypothetical protein